MPRIKIVQSNWSHGQASLKMSARSDTTLLDKTAQQIYNFVIMQQGGLSKRPGTKFITSFGNINNPILIPLKCSYGNFIIILYLTNDSKTFLAVYLDRIIYNKEVTLLSKVPINELKYSQLDNALLFTHMSIPPVKFEIKLDLSISINSYLMQYPPVNDFYQDYDNSTFTLSKKDGTPFKIGDNNIWILWKDSKGDPVAPDSRYTNGLYVGAGITIRITGGTSDAGIEYFVGILLDNDLEKQPDNPTTVQGMNSYFAEPVFSPLRGYPRCSAIYQNRLWYGGTRDLPSKIYASSTANFNRWESGTTNSDDPLNFQLSCDTSPIIEHIIASKNFVILTDVGEFAFLSTNNQPVVASNISILLQTKNGSTNCKPQELDDKLFYVQYGGNVIRSTDYSYNTNSYMSSNVSILCPEVINSPISSGTIKNLDNNDNSYLIYVNIDGTIACLQSVAEQDIEGWTTWFSEERDFISIVSVANNTYALLKNKAGEITLEQLSFNNYMDSIIDNVTITNGVGNVPAHLNNINVYVISDTGNIYMSLVNNGIIDIKDKVTGVFKVGIPINSILVTSPYSLRDAQIGDILLTPKKISNVYLYYYLSIGFNIIVNNNIDEVPNLKYDQSKYDTPLIPITNIYKSDVTIDWKLLETILITHNVPYPANILAIGATITI